MATEPERLSYGAADRATHSRTHEEVRQVNWDLEFADAHDASFGWALRCCGYDRAEADEVLQTAYLKILDGRARFDGRAQPRTFLFGVIRHTASERRRRERIRWLPPKRSIAAEPPTAPDETVGRSRETDALLRAMARLGRRQQEVLHLVFYGDMTIENAAGVMGVGVGTARTHYTRGKQRLRKLLEDRHDTD